VVSPAQLAQFFCHPVRALIEQRFGIRLREYEERIDDDEPFRHSRSQAEALRNRLTGFLVAGGDADATYRIEASRGELPAGQVGRLVHARALDDARVLASAVRASIAQAVMRTVEVDLAVGGVRIVGPIDGVGPQGMLHSRAVGEIDIWHRLRFWVQHLVLVVAEPGLTGPSRLLTLDGSGVFRVPEDAAPKLQVLVDLYRQGMCAPLPFFPRSSEAYVEDLRKAATRKVEPRDPLQAARKAWFGSDDHPGEVVDPYHRLAFPGVVPIDGRFGEIAQLVLDPLFDAMEREP
jgi:exodeoxyribonuclease V gamma subunit